MDRYPVWFNEEQNRIFDEIRKTAAEIGASYLIVPENSYMVTIRIPAKEITASMWVAVERYNTGKSSILVDLMLASEEMSGKEFLLHE